MQRARAALGPRGPSTALDARCERGNTCAPDGGWHDLIPIRVSLDRLLAERRISRTELAGRVDLTLANLSILKTGKARAIRFTTLEAICAALDCQPSDILSWQADDETPPA